MKVKVATATGPTLNWMVAKADGWSNEGLEDIANGDKYPEHDFSTNWAQGGPIIGRMGILFEAVHNGHVRIGLRAYRSETGTHGPHGIAQDHLTAAMRCYVACKLGDEVDVPEELLA
jgi:hypothetical protein